MRGRSGTESQEEHFIKGEIGNVFVILSIGWLIVQGGRHILPPLIPNIITDLGLTPLYAGILLTTLSVAYSIMTFPGGRMADQLSRKTVMVISLFLFIIGYSVFGVSNSYSQLLISIIIIGSACAMYFISMRAATADLYLHKRSQAFGIQMAFGNIGIALASGLILIVLQLATWRGVSLPLILPIIALLIYIHSRIDEKYVVEGVKFDLLGSLSRIMSNAEIRYALLIYILYVFTHSGVIGFLPTFLIYEKGFSTTLATAGFASVYILGTVAAPGAGFLGDRFNKKYIMTISLAVSFCALVAIIISDSIIMISMSIIGLAIGLKGFPPVMQALMMDTFSKDHMGSDFGVIKAIYSLCGSIGPTYIGLMASSWNYSIAFSGLTIVLIISVVLLFLWDGE